ncbi:hypothetical protein [Ectothiorhodospira mobilis]|uniref:hypothetical protein n=1 Tax=Ectothiorhodospira mobilis TaxID=195064 RepID=UPI001908F26B|nr:hypothetical protein [Ectothiorhodospira mobilis]
MTDAQSTSPRRRLQALLAIPESERTEEQWDEINELEISLAPVNQKDAPEPRPRKAPAQASRGAARQPRSAGNGRRKGVGKKIPPGAKGGNNKGGSSRRGVTEP